MIDLIFPDGSKREFEAGVTGKQVAASIAPSAATTVVTVIAPLVVEGAAGPRMRTCSCASAARSLAVNDAKTSS